jgi:cytochrome b561
MPITSAPSRYSAVAQAFHWIIAVLIVTQFTLAWTAAGLPLGAHKLGLLARHKSFGMTVLMLAVLRLAWRLFHPAPALPSGMSKVEKRLAKITHAAYRLAHVVGKKILGQLVWLIHLAQLDRQE